MGSPIYPRRDGTIQAKIAIGSPDDRYEREADRVAEQVTRLSSPLSPYAAPLPIQPIGAGAATSSAEAPVQRLCPECEEENLQRKPAAARAGPAAALTEDQIQAKTDMGDRGQPMSPEERAYFEPRFGFDFRHVRIHTGGPADSAARSVGALAFTRGHNIVFRAGQYRPRSEAGRRLLAHELTHVVQQGAAAGIRNRPAADHGASLQPDAPMHIGLSGQIVQFYPGDGMVPPGDCPWSTYLTLRGAVETAKAVVSTLGACSAADNCLTLAAKIAAISAEIAARVALDTTCFRGGDSGHRQQVQDKINMVNRCYRFFTALNCPQQLIEAMEAVIERAREVVAAVAMAVIVVAVIVALIAAVIVLIKAIIAAGATAATAAAAAAVMAVLVLVVGELSGESGPSEA